MKNSHILITGLVASALLIAGSAAEARQGVVRVHGTNGAASAVKGPNGGAAIRGRGAVQNEDGSVTAGRGAAYRRPNGGTGVRGSTTTVNPDGSGTHSGAYSASGPNGSVDSAGAVSRDAAGNWSGGRSTSATNATTGNSYQGSTSIDPETGQPVHSGSCYNANGDPISCPR